MVHVKIRRFIFACLFASLAQGFAFANDYAKEPVTYPSYDGFLLKANLWWPEEGAPPFPAVVYFHGGVADQDLPEEVMKQREEKEKKKKDKKTKSNGKHDGEPKWFLDGLLKEGYAVLMAGYRWDCVGGEKEVGDAIAAVRFLKSHENIDPRRIVVMGGSHGGFLTMHVLARGEDVAAAVNVDGPLDPIASFKLFHQSFGGKDVGKKTSQIADLYAEFGFIGAREYMDHQKTCYGENYDNQPAIQKVHDALYANVKNFNAPALVVCGRESPFRAFVLPSVQKLVEIAKKEGKDVTMTIVSPMRHGLSKDGFKLVLEFLRKHVKPEDSAKNIISGTGTIKYIGVEGGFYGLIADDGERYDPLNLSEEFQVDGLKVSFEAVLKQEVKTFHMWGIPVEIKKMKKKTER